MAKRTTSKQRRSTTKKTVQKKETATPPPPEAPKRDDGGLFVVAPIRVNMGDEWLHRHRDNQGAKPIRVRALRFSPRGGRVPVEPVNEADRQKIGGACAD